MLYIFSYPATLREDKQLKRRVWLFKRDKDDDFNMGIRTPSHSSRRLVLHTIAFLFDLGLIVAILCPKIFNQESSVSRMGWREEG